MIDLEARILERVLTGGFQTPDRLPTWVTDLLFDAPFDALSAEQRKAAVRLVASRDLITVMSAPAGAGKTTSLAAAARLWERCHRDVITLAPSARAAAELVAATGTRGETVARWLHRQRHLDGAAVLDASGSREGRGRLTAGSVVVVDEASMLTTTDLDELTVRVHDANAALVLVGDPAQIGAVNAPGGMFELISTRLGPWTVELTELHRFRDPWEGAATLRLRAGEAHVLDEYALRGRIHPAATSEDAADAAFDQWRRVTEYGCDALLLARSWADVTALNARARAVAVATGSVTGPVLATIASRSASTRGHPEARQWRAGDVLLAKKNNTRIPLGSDTVRNGDRFRVIATATTGLVVEDLSGRGGTTLPTAYLARYAEYGWAATIDGAQGATADIGIVVARSGLDREHLYVAMSRGRDENHVHTTPELNTGDAGPHRTRSTPRPVLAETSTQSPAQPATRPRKPAPAPTQSLAQPLPGLLHHRDHPLAVRPAQADLDAAIALLATAVNTSGRERAAHTLLDSSVQSARERDWEQAERTRPPRQPSREHLQHQRALERARTNLVQARELVQELAAYRRDLEERRAALPFWARGRRQQLTTRLENRAETPWLQKTTDSIGPAERAVESASRVVDADAEQRVADDEADRQRRHQRWAEHVRRPYTDPNPVIVRSSPVVRDDSSWHAYDDYRTVEPPSQGYGLSR